MVALGLLLLFSGRASVAAQHIEAARSNWPVYALGIYLVNASIVTIGNLVLPTLMLVTSVRELQT